VNLIKEKDHVSIIELKQLLHELKDYRLDIAIRFRMIGEMWQNSSLKIVSITEQGAIFTNQELTQYTSINDLKSVIQFELDGPFKQYQPYVHYVVDLSFMQLS
jgi:hypothetical protein